MSLKDTITRIEWNEAYSTKTERLQIYCPNCGSKIEWGVGEVINPPMNGSNQYWCANCEVEVLVFFRDNEKWDSELILSSQIRGIIKSFLWGIMGFLFMFLMAIRGVF